MAEEAPPIDQAAALWQVRLDAPVASTIVPVADGVLVPLKRGGRSSVRRISVDDGESVWETMFDGPLVAELVRTGNVLAVPLTEGRLVSVDLTDGSGSEVQWATQMGEFSSPAIGRRGVIYLRLMAGTGTKLVAFRAGQGAALWEEADPTKGAPDARLAFAHDTLVMAATTGDKAVTAYGVTARDGKCLWENTDAEGTLQDLWAIADVVDLVTDADGILGINVRTGVTRNQRFADFPFERAYEVAETLVMVTRAKGKRVMFSFTALGEQIQGRLREPLECVVGASPSEVLLTMADGTPALYTLPGLKQVLLPDADVIGTVSQVAFSRDVAYLVGEDRHTLTAIDLEAVR